MSKDELAHKLDQRLGTAQGAETCEAALVAFSAEAQDYLQVLADGLTRRGHPSAVRCRSWECEAWCDLLETVVDRTVIRARVEFDCCQLPWKITGYATGRDDSRVLFPGGWPVDAAAWRKFVEEAATVIATNWPAR